MSNPELIVIEAQSRDHALRLARLRSKGQKIFGLPGLRKFRPLARRVFLVAEPAGQLAIQACPDSRARGGCAGMNILSANLWHDWPRYRQRTERLESFARLVEQQRADIILLQEVARTHTCQVDEWLAQRLGMGYVYSRANGHQTGIGFEEGLAVFSRYPISQPQLRQLGAGTNPFVRRLALGVVVDSPCGKLYTFSVHLGLTPQQNAAQLDDLRAWVAEIAGDNPALIGGDFNAHESTTQILQAQKSWLDTFRHLHPEKDGTTHHLRWPWGGSLKQSRLDYIFFQPGISCWKVVDTRHLDGPEGPHSDHRAVLTRLMPC